MRKGKKHETGEKRAAAGWENWRKHKAQKRRKPKNGWPQDGRLQDGWPKEEAPQNEALQEERRKNQVRTLQTALWAGLILVQMMVVNSLTVQAGQAHLLGQAAQPFETEKTAALRPVEKTVTYRRVEGAASLPEQMTVTVKAGGSSYEVVCEAAEQQVLKEYWLEDFRFPITFHSYDSQYFQIGEQLIPYNAEQPGLEHCDLQLLSLLGLSPAEYQVDSVVWDGEAYRDKGVLCRNAIGAGRRLVRDYEVRYVGSIPLPEQEESEENAGAQQETGAATEETETESAALPTVRETEAPEAAVAVLEEQDEANSEKFLTLWQIITRTMLAIVGIGAILFLGGLLVLLIRKIRRFWKRP